MGFKQMLNLTGASCVFKMRNNYSQNSEIGICTCISLHWAKKCLLLNRGLNSFSEIGLNPHIMNIQMATLRKLDSDPAGQCDLVGLRPIGGDRDISGAGIEDVARIAKAVAPHVAIFWTSTHTMGFRYSDTQKEFFDVEVGLFRSKYDKTITNKMRKVINNYGAVKGMRVVALQA